MLWFTVLSLCLGVTVAVNTYIATIPNAVIPGIPLNFHVTILKASSDVFVTVDLKHGNNGSVIASKTESVKTGDPTSIQLQIPENLRVSSVPYKISVRGSGGLTFYNESNIYYDNNLFIFVQTDKSRYSAGQRVLYRAVLLKPNLMGYTDEFSIEIMDGKKHKLRRLTGQKSANGVFNGSMLISDEPVFGDWKIIVAARGKVVEHVITVNPYNLPRFSVTIHKKDAIGQADTIVDINVEARFVFNKPVHGTAVLLIYENTPDGNSVYNSTKAISGLASFHVPVTTIKQRLSYNFDNVVVRAMVTDNATSLTMIDESPLIFKSDGYFRVERHQKRMTFVPGLPYYDSLAVTNNGHSIGKSGTVQLHINSISGTLSTCSDGSKKFVPSTRQLMLKTMKYNSTGIFSFVVDVPQNAVKLVVEVTGADMSTLSYNLIRVTPQDQSKMIRLTANSNPILVGQNASFQLKSKQRLNGFVIFEAYSRNTLVTTKKIVIYGSHSMGFSFLTETSMIPKIHVLALYVGRDGSTFSDVVEVAVNGEALNNRVSISLNATSVEVQKKVTFTVKADPGSKVYILTEDKRNRLLGTSNDIYKAEVDLYLRNSFRLPEDNIQHFRRSLTQQIRIISTDPFNKRKRDFDQYGDTDDAFIEAGVIFLSDTHALERTQYFPYDITSYPSTCPCYALFCKALQLLYGKGLASHSMGLASHSMGHASYSIGYGYNSIGGNAVIQTGGTSYSGPSFNPGSLLKFIRSRFPETWLWEEITVGQAGSTTVVKEVPDSITTWVTSAFATNSISGFGIATNKTELVVFKKFFITVDMPATVVSGEEFLLQVTVFNYLSSKQQVVMQITQSDDPGNTIPQATMVPKNKGHSVFIHITPKTTGKVDILIRAKAGDMFTINAFDSVKKTVSVQPAGVYQQVNHQQLIDVSTASFSKIIPLANALHMVPGSKSVHLSVTGDFMALSISGVTGLQKLLRMPHGCGEQIMLNFAPNIYIMDYLKASRKSSLDFEKNVKQFLESGLQQELRHQHDDGSFSAFTSDNVGSSWLTAFVLKCFHQAKRLVYIYDKIMTEAMEWLLTKQRSDGQFYEPGRIIHTTMQSGTGSGLKLTAFILISLLENRDIKINDASKLSNSIQKGKHYLETNMHSITNVYTLSLVCYALSMASSSQTTTCHSKLKTSSMILGDLRYWQSSTTVNLGKREPNRRSQYIFQRASAKDIETTAYALLFLNSERNIVDALPVARWLVSQRNSNGGFSSTQDTIIALQALSQFAALTNGINGSSQANYGVRFNATAGLFSHVYSVNKTNFDLHHQIPLPDSLSDITIHAQGVGSALFDVTMSYYVSSLPTNSRISVTASIKSETLNSVTAQTCARWHGTVPSGMILMEVEIPTGFVPDNNHLDAQSHVRRHESQGRGVALYFDRLSRNQQVCADVKSDRSDPVVKSQACHVTVYDYYEPHIQAMARYESGILKNSTICNVCPECNFCNHVLVGKRNSRTVA